MPEAHVSGSVLLGWLCGTWVGRVARPLPVDAAADSAQLERWRAVAVDRLAEAGAVAGIVANYALSATSKWLAAGTQWDGRIIRRLLFVTRHEIRATERRSRHNQGPPRNRGQEHRSTFRRSEGIGAMAYRELTVTIVREVLRRWQNGQKLRSIAKSCGVDRKTVGRYVEAAKRHGLPVGGGAETLTDEVVGAIARGVQVGAPVRHGSGHAVCQKHVADLLMWHKQ
ncbi:MAG: hypothetical protein FJX42_12585, partial [Alphaproteobacteria bacterium]|nr:hypothetical protein [Alphaproteobacteria bacterium]